MTFFVFFLLSLLVAVEASTSIARRVGYMVNTPATGLFLQSSMALISRVLIFMFVPLIGYMADAEVLSIDYAHAGMFLMIIFAIYMVYSFRVLIGNLCYKLINNINDNGSLYKASIRGCRFADSFTRKPIRKLKKFYLLVCVSYVPYYLAWPLVMLLLSKFHENRAFVIGIASVFNGISTIILTIGIDPALARMGSKRRFIQNVYVELLLVRVIAALLALIIYAVFIYVFL